MAHIAPVEPVAPDAAKPFAMNEDETAEAVAVEAQIDVEVEEVLFPEQECPPELEARNRFWKKGLGNLYAQFELQVQIIECAPVPLLMSFCSNPHIDPPTAQPFFEMPLFEGANRDLVDKRMQIRVAREALLDKMEKSVPLVKQIQSAFGGPLPFGMLQQAFDEYLKSTDLVPRQVALLRGLLEEAKEASEEHIDDLLGNMMEVVTDVGQFDGEEDESVASAAGAADAGLAHNQTWNLSMQALKCWSWCQTGTCQWGVQCYNARSHTEENAPVQVEAAAAVVPAPVQVVAAAAVVPAPAAPAPAPAPAAADIVNFFGMPCPEMQEYGCCSLGVECPYGIH